MKSLKRSFKIITAAAMGLILFQLPSNSLAGREGNGGGGLVRNGRYLTFGSAQVRVRPTPVENIRGLSLLTRVLKEAKLDNNSRGVVLDAVLPSMSRSYFEIDPIDLSDRQRQELLSIYGNIVNLPPENLVIFAVTDIKKRETYVLPEFNKLEIEEEAAAILFHEAAWLLNSKLTYSEVVDLEMQMQGFLEAHHGKTLGYEPVLYQILGKTTDLSLLPLTMAVREDHEQRRFERFGQNGLPLEVLLGDSRSWNGMTLAQFKGHAQAMNLKYPEMATFPAILSSVKSFSASFFFVQSSKEDCENQFRDVAENNTRAKVNYIGDYNQAVLWNMDTSFSSLIVGYTDTKIYCHISGYRPRNISRRQFIQINLN